MEPGLPEDIAVQIRAGLRRQYDKPPVNETEAVLRANATPDRVRQLIYWPDADDAALYPRLIATPPPGAPKDHPAARCQVTYLTALYLHHAKRWTFVKPFVLAGGLRATADLLVHPNLHLRGQAMEAFGLMTSESLFPWHDPPRPGTSDVAVHQRMLELARSPLLPNLAANYDGSFPGGSAAALRILAFFASWLRLRHCPGNVLRLSSELLRLLERWSTRGDGSDDERALAKALRDDFSRFEATDEATTRIDASGTPNVTTSEEAIDSSPARVVLGVDEADACVVVADRTTKLSSSSDAETNDAEASADVDAGESHKKRGNEYFAAGDWSAAIDAYSAAVDAPVSYARLFDGRAACITRRPDLSGGEPKGSPRGRRGHLDALWCAEDDGRAAELNNEALTEDAGWTSHWTPSEIQKGDGAVALGRTDEARAVRRRRGANDEMERRRDCCCDRRTNSGRVCPRRRGAEGAEPRDRTVVTGCRRPRPSTEDEPSTAKIRIDTARRRRTRHQPVRVDCGSLRRGGGGRARAVRLGGGSDDAGRTVRRFRRRVWTLAGVEGDELYDSIKSRVGNGIRTRVDVVGTVRDAASVEGCGP